MNCSSFGKCQHTEEDKYECICDNLHDGLACENDLHPCAKTKCLNDAKCYEKEGFNGIDNLEVGCNCTGLYYGKYCQEKINICQNETCSGHGVCYENNSLPACNCFSKYEGDKCEIKSQELVSLQKKVKTASYLAFVCIGLCYGLFIFLDSLTYVMMFEPKRTSRYKLRHHRPYRLKYKNFDTSIK